MDDVLDLQIEESVIRSLREINTLLNEASAEKDTCIDNFNEWRRIRREETIPAVQEFQNEFDTIHVSGSVARATGSVTTVVGGLATIIGFGLSFSKELKTVGDQLMKYGNNVGNIGSATTIVASLAEMGFNANTFRKVKKALREDQRLTEKLLPWLRRANRLDELLQEIFDCGFADGVLNILKFIKDICFLVKEGGNAFQNIVDYLSLAKDNLCLNGLTGVDEKKFVEFLKNAGCKVKTLLKECCKNPKVREATLAIYESLKKNPELYEFSKASNCVVGKLKGQETALCSLISLTDDKFRMTGYDCFFQAISVALSIYAFVTAVKDFENGKSKYSVMLEKIEKCLLLELQWVVFYLSPYA